MENYQKNYVLDPVFKANLPQNISQVFENLKRQGFYKAFPFGSDFTETEEQIIFALKKLKKESKPGLIIEIMKSIFKSSDTQKYKEELERMSLLKTQNLREKIYQKLLVSKLGAP